MPTKHEVPGSSPGNRAILRELFLCLTLFFLFGKVAMFKSIATVLVLLFLTACSHMNIATNDCKVTGKESISGKESHQYRLYTSCGTYVIEDQLTRLNFSSADIYGSIEVNKTYSITSSGYRVSFLSMFKAVNSIHPK